MTYPQRGDVAISNRGGVFVFGRRKDDNSGWWSEGRGGLSDRALASGDWVIVSKADLVELFNRVRAAPTGNPTEDPAPPGPARPHGHPQ